MPSGWREQYDRMRRWLTRVGEFKAVDDRGVDDFHAFFLTCFHLRDWLQNDSALDAKIGADAKDFVNRNKWLGNCADVANGSKHLRLDNRARIDPAARVEKTTLKFDTAGFSPDAFMSQDFIVVPAAGTPWIALAVAKEAVAAWDSFLLARGLLPRTCR
jgi:hypothetical protein